MACDTKAGGRPRRQTRPSLKKQEIEEAGEKVPGLFAEDNEESEQASEDGNHRSLTSSILPNNMPYDRIMSRDRYVLMAGVQP
jgi:hypothetical protein